MPDDLNQQTPSIPSDTPNPSPPTAPTSPEPPEQPESPQPPISPESPQPEIPQAPPEIPPTPEPPPPVSEPQVEAPPQPQIIEKEVIKEVTKEIPVVNQEEVQRQVEEKLQERLKLEAAARRKLALQARIKKKEDNLNKTLEFVRVRKIVTAFDIRDLLHVSKSTATKYLSELVKRGQLRREGTRGSTRYSA